MPTERLKFDDYANRLPELLDMLTGQRDTLLLERDGQLYRITNITLPVHDPDEVREALRKSAGALKNVDIEEFKRDLREMRQQDTKGRPA